MRSFIASLIFFMSVIAIGVSILGGLTYHEFLVRLNWKSFTANVTLSPASSSTNQTVQLQGWLNLWQKCAVTETGFAKCAPLSNKSPRSPIDYLAYALPYLISSVAFGLLICSIVTLIQSISRRVTGIILVTVLSIQLISVVAAFFAIANLPSRSSIASFQFGPGTWINCASFVLATLAASLYGLLTTGYKGSKVPTASKYALGCAPRDYEDKVCLDMHNVNSAASAEYPFGGPPTPSLNSIGNNNSAGRFRDITYTQPKLPSTRMYPTQGASSVRGVKRNEVGKIPEIKQISLNSDQKSFI
jgi:hypothetical protein